MAAGQQEIGFLLTAAAVYFFMVAPMNVWKARQGFLPPKKCPECLSEIPRRGQTLRPLHNPLDGEGRLAI